MLAWHRYLPDRGGLYEIETPDGLIHKVTHDDDKSYTVHHPDGTSTVNRYIPNAFSSKGRSMVN